MNLLNKLTIKHLTMNKKRTLVTIIGVVLSCALMVGIGLIFSSIRDYTIKEIKAEAGEHHIKINNLNSEQIKKLENNKNINTPKYEQGIGYSILKKSKNEYKPYLYVNSGNQSFLESLKLIKGRLPANEFEVVISEHIETNAHVNYNIGDTLKLEIGNRYFEDVKITENSRYLYEEEKPLEKFIIEKNIEYKIVGVVKRHYSESYEAAGYSIYTLNKKLIKEELVNGYITFSTNNKLYEKIEILAETLNLKYEEYEKEKHYSDIDYNTQLITMYGQSKNYNFNSAIIKVIIIMLSIISIGCIVVIYNSFAISVMERKKQFGLFSSIGATNKQLQKTVFFEAFIIGIIGIPVGLISSFIGIGTVLMIINMLLSDIFTTKLTLSFYPLFIIIPIAFMIVVIFLSALIPARMASKISPIKAIRLNDDIKINPKKIKTPKIVSKIFGIEGEIAHKNIKRNKRKYRVTVVSLVVSIVMFISFSSFLQYGEQGTQEYLNLVDYDISVYIQSKHEDIYDQVANQLRNQEELENILVLERLGVFTPRINDNNLHENYKNILKSSEIDEDYNYGFDEEYMWMNLYKVDSDTYNKYKDLLKTKEDVPIIINQFNMRVGFGNNGQIVKGKYLKNIKSLKFDICSIAYNETDYNNPNYKCIHKLENILEVNEILFGMSELVREGMPHIILPDNLFELIKKDNNMDDNMFIGKEIKIKTSDTKVIKKVLEPFQKHPDIDYIEIIDIVEQAKLQRNLMLVIKILLYGFISLVTLIGVTSVFNTINTSVALRRKEFAILRSVGLTPKGFNKMLKLETVIVGLKSLLYSIPFLTVIIIMLHLSVGEMVNFSSIIIPVKGIVIAVFGVFLIITITMLYATKKIKHENILDSIREENI